MSHDKNELCELLYLFTPRYLSQFPPATAILLNSERFSGVLDPNINLNTLESIIVPIKISMDNNKPFLEAKRSLMYGYNRRQFYVS